MKTSPLRLIKAKIELVDKQDINRLPRNIRGLYVLFAGKPEAKVYNVRYVGMSTTGVRPRLLGHRNAKGKRSLWSHCSVFEVWDNVSDREIKELEGLLRHIYRCDEIANELNRTKSFATLKKVDKIELI